jgi:cytochrome c biogenesis protein CcmG, thiol:disulfide interchange protein DsbE
MRPQHAVWIGAGVIAAIVVAALGWSLLSGMKKSPSVVGGPAPRLAIRSLTDARVIRLADLRGTPVVINFWASWCVACREEAPVLNAAAQRYAGRVQFLGADFRDSEQAARRYQEEIRSPYPVGPIVEGTYQAFGVTAPPETFFIDRRGVVISRITGPVDARSLDIYIGQLRPAAAAQSEISPWPTQAASNATNAAPTADEAHRRSERRRAGMGSPSS